jgi:hypothetical protein
MIHQEKERTLGRFRTGAPIGGLVDNWSGALASDEGDAICIPCLERLKSGYCNDDWEIRITLN